MRTWFVTALLILVPLTAIAQTTATVTANAPIYISNTPAAGQLPLRVAAVGTTLRVHTQEGDWLQVEFNDPQWGQRRGWIQAKFTNYVDETLRPMDLSVPDAQATPASAQRSQADAVGQAQTTAAAVETGRPQIREGFWFSVGLGYGSLGCENCSVREDGLSGGLSLGGTLGDKWLLGVGTTGWAKEIDGELLSAGTLDARFRFYPVRTSGFFLNGGLGVGTLSYAGESEIGVGLMLGLGWDIRIGRNVSLTPFWNGFAMRNSVANANVGQLGLGVTLH